MAPTTDRLREHLVPEESLGNVYAATLSDDGASEDVSVGVTDRRLLCLGADGSFLTVGYDSICAIRSRPRSTVTCRGNDYRLVFGAGAALALLGVAALVALSGSLAVVALALVTVAAVAATALLSVDETLAQVTLDDVDERMADDFDGVDALRRVERTLPDGVAGRHVVLAGGALVSLATLSATVAVASTALVVLPLGLVLAGVAVAEFARRNAGDLDGIEVAREHARNVRIRTDDGRTVRLAVDPSADVDRELSRRAFADRDEAARPVSARA